MSAAQAAELLLTGARGRGTGVGAHRVCWLQDALSGASPRSVHGDGSCPLTGLWREISAVVGGKPRGHPELSLPVPSRNLVSPRLRQ